MGEYIKGGDKKKKRGRMKFLTYANSKAFYRMNNIFLCIVEIIFLNWYKAYISWMLRNNNKLFCRRKKNFYCVWRCPIEHPETFFGKMFYYFFWTAKKSLFWTNYLFLLILLQKYNFYCKAPNNPHAFFILPKFFLVCSIGHLYTQWKKFSRKIFYNLFLTSMKIVFCIN